MKVQCHRTLQHTSRTGRDFSKTTGSGHSAAARSETLRASNQ